MAKKQSNDTGQKAYPGEPARLFPVLAENSKEGRALSILLSCIVAVPDFGRTLLTQIGVRLHSRGVLETFTEVVLDDADKRSLRPDGLITVTSSSSAWRALVEAKIRNAKLDNQQIKSYVDLAKANNCNAVITISNDFAAIPSHHPTYTERLPAHVDLFHFSWTSILTHAKLLLHGDELGDAAHRFLISELIRFLDHPSSGLTRFDHMPETWKPLVTSVTAGAGMASLHKEAPHVTDAVASWHQETRDLALQLTGLVSSPVAIKLPRHHVNDPQRRIADDADALCAAAQLRAEYKVPNAAGPIEVTADLRGRSLIVSMKVDAPEDRVSTKARLNWLLRQLQKSAHDDLHIVAHWPRTKATTQAPLAEVREDPGMLDLPGRPNPAIAFTVRMVRHVGARFAGSRTFIREIEAIVPAFYAQVGQRLKVWQPPPPKLSPAPKDMPAAEPEATPSDSNPSPSAPEPEVHHEVSRPVQDEPRWGNFD